MSDPREDILARLVVLAGTISGIRTVKRNQTDIAETQFPAIVIMDADEQASDGDPAHRPRNAPRMITMSPEMYILLSDKAVDVGTSVNALRAAFIKAVLTDSALAALTMDGQGIRYEASVTGLSRGRSMIGEVGISFSFTYVLRPDSL